MEPIGAVFTPAPWGRFAVARSGFLSRWLSGASVLDPTMGTGNLLSALVEAAIGAGHPVEALPFDRLWGVEIEAGFRSAALETFRGAYGVDMSGQFLLEDLFASGGPRCDLILGNPPWKNFDDLPEDCKPAYKARFLHHGLVPGAHQVLLGRSRVDLAALVVQKAILDHLNPGGEAWFFLPLSLLFNDGAHEAFRRYQTGGVPFRPTAIDDFRSQKVFPGVSTRFGLVGFVRDELPRFPVPYRSYEGGQWVEREARPVFGPTAPLNVFEPGATGSWEDLDPIPVPKQSFPRQGVNTGGANRVFFFDRWEAEGPELCRVGEGVLLPRKFVHPLVTARQFREPGSGPERWVLLPCKASGKPLTPAELEAEPLLAAYLGAHRTALQGRKGALLAAWANRGIWWALLGMGPYSFAPFKVVWEAYGRTTFRPLVLEGVWQANQSLQAFLPCWSSDEAQRLVTALRHPPVEAYLRSLQMAGTMNWAQPGRVRRLLVPRDE